MAIHTTIHNVRALTVRSVEIDGMEPFWNTEVTATDKDGQALTFAFLSDAPVAIEGAEHVNHVASPQTEPMTVGVFDEVPV